MKNELYKENSPYLLQHAKNPVHWQGWNDHTLQLAKEQDKPILISVGYAACHWCHVMEKECFEDREVSEVMNRYFINVKVDREERPDIDQWYMSALQIMTRSGGWPMNIVALPDGRPFWGGTYLHKDQWISVLKQLGDLYTQERAKVEEYASRLTEGIGAINRVIPPQDPGLPTKADLEKALHNWKQYMDPEFGGRKGAPKFMMPVNLNFLLNYMEIAGDDLIGTYVNNSLKQMSYGGVYDHLGGGFARYSTDERWHVPHFEMMLYDNAQLLTTYALAYKKYRNPEYLEVIEGIHTFITRELKGPQGELYSSLDADSLDTQGLQEEGAFYTWTEEELRNALGEDFKIAEKCYNINPYGHWENGRYVLIRSAGYDQLAEEFGISTEDLIIGVKRIKNKLLTLRNSRPKPALDDKCLTSWNAMAVTGLANAFLATEDHKYLKTAIGTMDFLEKVMFREDRDLLHSYRDGKAKIPGFLEDYCFFIEACITLYSSGCGEKYLLMARDVCNHTLDRFFDENNNMFRFTSGTTDQLFRQTIEKSDNVIPASNSVMAHILHTLGAIFGNTAYLKTSKEMLLRMKEDMIAYGYSHAHWLSLTLLYTFPAFEVAITGKHATANALKLQQQFLPNTVFAFSETQSSLPLLRERHIPGKDLFYVCREQQCNLPVNDLEACLQQLKTYTK